MYLFSKNYWNVSVIITSLKYQKIEKYHMTYENIGFEVDINFTILKKQKIFLNSTQDSI